MSRLSLKRDSIESALENLELAKRAAVPILFRLRRKDWGWQPMTLSRRMHCENYQEAKRQLHVLQLQIRKRQRELAAPKGLGFYFSRLPYEIVRTIFLYATYKFSSEQTFKLGLVCKEWRVLALSMPELWRTLCITKYSNGHGLLAVLKRSQGTIRRLSLDLGFVFDPRPFLNELIPEHVWTSVKAVKLKLYELPLYGPTTRQLNLNDIARIFGAMQSLRSIEFIGYGRIWEVNWCLDHWGFGFAPTFIQSQATKISTPDIRSLIFNYTTPPWEYLPRLHTLTELVIRCDIVSRGLLHVLRANPNLEKLVIHTMRLSVSRSWDNESQIVLPHLKLFNVKNAVDFFSAGIDSGRLVFPKLESLILDTARQCQDHTPMLLSGLIHEKNKEHFPSNLQVLRIRNSYDLSSKVIVDVLRRCANLVTLELALLDSVKSSEFVTEFLMGYPKTHLLCPKLQSLTLNGLHTLSGAELLRIIRARLPTICLFPDFSQSAIPDVFNTQSSSSQVHPISELSPNAIAFPPIGRPIPASQSLAPSSRTQFSTSITHLRRLIIHHCPNVEIELLPLLKPHLDALKWDNLDARALGIQSCDCPPTNQCSILSKVNGSERWGNTVKFTTRGCVFL